MINIHSAGDNHCLFALANIGDVHLFEYWMNIKI